MPAIPLWTTVPKLDKTMLPPAALSCPDSVIFPQLPKKRLPVVVTPLMLYVVPAMAALNVPIVSAEVISLKLRDPTLAANVLI